MVGDAAWHLVDHLPRAHGVEHSQEKGGRWGYSPLSGNASKGNALVSRQLLQTEGMLIRESMYGYCVPRDVSFDIPDACVIPHRK